jgi:peptidylprolyl isomerase/FKBP-type peptidyl-prolyl cis-trans isomerase FkpA
MLTKIFIPCFFVLSLFSAGAFYYYKSNQPDYSTPVATSIDRPLQSYAPKQSNAKSESSLQVKGADSATEPTKNALPEPSEFEVYEANKNDPSPSFIDIKLGTGSEAVKGSAVSMLYKGYLTDGTVFDQTKVNEDNKFEAFTFQLGAGQVIAGWDAGIAGMKVGGARRLIIPAQFGYGATGQGPIPPNSMLIFDVELVQVQ